MTLDKSLKFIKDIPLGYKKKISIVQNEQVLPACFKKCVWELLSMLSNEILNTEVSNMEYFNTTPQSIVIYLK